LELFGSGAHPAEDSDEVDVDAVNENDCY